MRFDTARENMFRVLQTTSLVLVLGVLAWAIPQGTQPPPTNRKGQSITSKLGDFNDLAPDTRLSALTYQDFDEFFANTESVQAFTDCLATPSKCNSPSGRNLVRQITSLGDNGQCADCGPEEQSRINDLIYYFVKSYREKHPELWDRILPRIIHIISNA